MKFSKTNVNDAFKSFDLNSDGFITTKELYDTLLKVIKVKDLTYNDIDLMMVAINKNRDGKMKI